MADFNEDFHIKNIRRYLDETVAKMNNMQSKLDTKVGKIMPIKKCVSFGYFNPCDFIPKNYFGTKREIEKQEDIDNCIKLATESLNKTLAENEVIHNDNLIALENNKNLKEAIQVVMESAGIPMSYTTYEYSSSRSRTKKQVTKTAGYREDIARCIVTSDGYDSIKSDYDSQLKKIAEWKKTIEDILKKKLEEKNKETKEKDKITKALKLAMELGIDTECSTKELFDLVEEKSKEKYIQENYPDGTEMDSHCDECSTWIVGEHRCSCGNRRMSLTVEGSILEGGYSAYAEHN